MEEWELLRVTWILTEKKWKKIPTFSRNDLSIRNKNKRAAKDKQYYWSSPAGGASTSMASQSSQALERRMMDRPPSLQKNLRKSIDPIVEFWKES